MYPPLPAQRMICSVRQHGQQLGLGLCVSNQDLCRLARRPTRDDIEHFEHFGTDRSAPRRNLFNQINLVSIRVGCGIVSENAFVIAEQDICSRKLSHAISFEFCSATKDCKNGYGTFNAKTVTDEHKKKRTISWWT